MRPEQVLEHKPNVLSEAQRRSYFADGCLALPGLVPQHWLDRLNAASAELLERSRSYSESDQIYILEEGHSAERPRLHRVSIPEAQHPTFWEFMQDPSMTDLVADVVGPGVRFHHGKLNLKSAQGSRGFKWHQDIQSWPHTDFSPVTVGVYLDGCDADMGPLSFVRGSHLGPLYSMYDDAGNWAVRVREEELAWLTDEMIVRPTGPAGTVVLVNCRVIHGSEANRGGRDRPLLLSVYSSADSFPFTVPPIPSPRLGTLVRGQPARHVSMEPYPALLPPDFSGGYTMPWIAQANEEKQRARQAAE